jgi:Asp/Glu/hydantoin racemase
VIHVPVPHVKGRIALLHALPESVEPIRTAFMQLWPEADTFNVLDDALSRDRAASTTLTDKITQRVAALSQYAMRAGHAGAPTVGMLFTGTAFGPAIIEARKGLSVPLLTPNEAAFSEAAQLGGRVALLVTFLPSLKHLQHDMRVAIETADSSATLSVTFVPGALQALQRGDAQTHDELIAETAAATSADVHVLGQFSMARAASAVTAKAGALVITTPGSAVRALRRRLEAA